MNGTREAKPAGRGDPLGDFVFSASPPSKNPFFGVTVSNIGFRNSPKATASKSRAAFHILAGSAGVAGRAIGIPTGKETEV
jgi:hypothetical protein